MLREDFGGLLCQGMDSRTGNGHSVHQDLGIWLWREAISRPSCTIILDAAPPMSMRWVTTSSLRHMPLCTQIMREEPQRSCDLVPLALILSLTLIHLLPKVNKSGPFLGTRWQALLVSVPPKLRWGHATPCEGRTSPTGHAPRGTASLAAGTSVLVPSLSRRFCRWQRGHVSCTSQPCTFRHLSPATPPAFLFKHLCFSQLLPGKGVQANNLWGRGGFPLGVDFLLRHGDAVCYPPVEHQGCWLRWPSLLGPKLPGCSRELSTALSKGDGVS